MKLNARLDGPANAPAVVLVHSLGTDMRLWDEQLPALTGFRVLRIDLRGHGASPAPRGPYHLDDLAQDLLAAADNFSRFHIVGVSLGAQVALAAALLMPDRIAGIAVCNTRTDVPPDFAAAIDARNAIIRAQGMAPIAATAPSRWLSPTTLTRHPELAARVAEMVACASPEGFIACTEAIKRSTLGARLADVAVPSLFVASTEDDGLPTAIMQAMAAQVPNSRYAEIPDAGHLSPLENPASFNAALLAFLKPD